MAIALYHYPLLVPPPSCTTQLNVFFIAATLSLSPVSIVVNFIPLLYENGSFVLPSKPDMINGYCSVVGPTLKLLYDR